MKNKKKTVQHKTPDPEALVLDSVTQLLQERGWKVLVIGGMSVEQPFGSANYNFQFVVKFTGAKYPKETPA